MCPRICAFLYTCKQELVILGWMKTDALEGVPVCEEDVYLVEAGEEAVETASEVFGLIINPCLFCHLPRSAHSSTSLPMQCYNMLQRQVRFDLFKISI